MNDQPLPPVARINTLISFPTRLAISLGAIAIASTTARAMTGGDAPGFVVEATDARCICVAITVAVPAPLRSASRVSFEVRLKGVTGILGSTKGEILLAHRREVQLVLSMPSQALTEILDVADVHFRTSDGVEFVIPILLRLSAFIDMLAVAESAPPANYVEISPIAPIWSAGFETGVQQAGLAGHTAGFDSPRTGLAAALYVDRRMGPRWSLRTGLGFAQRGGTSRTTGSTVAVAMNYLEVPLVARYRLPNFRSIVPVVFGGPTVALRVSCALKLSGAGLNSVEPCTQSGSGDPRSFDAGIVVGAGAQVPVGPLSLELGARHTSGLVSIGVPIDVRNSGWSFTAGTTVPLSRLVRSAGARPGLAPRGGTN